MTPTRPNSSQRTVDQLLGILEEQTRKAPPSTSPHQGAEYPQIVVIGDQSSGKSSVLEALTGMPFPRSGGESRWWTTISLKRKIGDIGESFKKTFACLVLVDRNSGSLELAANEKSTLVASCTSDRGLPYDLPLRHNKHTSPIYERRVTAAMGAATVGGWMMTGWDICREDIVARGSYQTDAWPIGYVSSVVSPQVFLLLIT